MASIVKVQRKKGLAVYISYRTKNEDGHTVQHKYRCRDFEDANRRLVDVNEAERENRVYVGYETSNYSDKATTVADLVDEYLEHHARTLSASTMRNYVHICDHYIKPFIGRIPLEKATTAFLQRYYDDLPNHPASQGNHKSSAGNISARTVREVHKVLRPAFRLAVKWQWITSNPANDLELPSIEPFTRRQWTAEVAIDFINRCNDADLKVATAVMFSATLRSGELAGLTWDCVDISEKAMEQKRCSICVQKTIERLQKESILKSKNDIIKLFPATKAHGSTVVVMKQPKTPSSIRTVYLPLSVANLLVEHRQRQQEYRDRLGDLYRDYNLVFCHGDGSPFTPEYLGKRFKRLVNQMGLEEVDLYSLRHSGATAKLRATGNIKAVQGDMGHSSTDMLLNVYAGIHDEDRRNIATAMDQLWQDRVNRKDNPDGKNEEE